jgi:hypothetical protein
MIDMSLRRQKPGTDSSYEFMLRRTAMYSWPDLRPILRGIDWVLIGGVATRAYMLERTTKDMDVLVCHSDGDEVIARLQEAGYHIAYSHLHPTTPSLVHSSSRLLVSSSPPPSPPLPPAC